MTTNLFYIAQYFTPEPYLKDITFVKSLQEKGWNPVVITGFPNYPKGEIYEGYRNRIFAEENMDGIRVIRVFTYADHSLSSIKRTLNYFVFGFFAALAILKYGSKNSFYYILQSSPFVVFCAWAVKLFKPNSKTLLDIQDVFPENIRVSGFIKSETVINILDFLLDHLYYRFFDLFVTVSESFRKIISAKNINPDRILTLYNWSMVEEKPGKETVPYRFGDQGKHIVYAGNIGVHQGLSKLVEGMHRVTARNPQIYFHFFGDGTDYEFLSAASSANPNIILHGRVPADEIGKYLEAADILFLHLIKDPIYECIIPSKLQAYIEVGKPILGGIEGEARSFITDHALGEVFTSENNDGFEKATENIIRYSNEKTAAIYAVSKKLYSEKFSREAGAQSVHEFIKKHVWQQ